MVIFQIAQSFDIVKSSKLTSGQEEVSGVPGDTDTLVDIWRVGDWGQVQYTHHL